jgi:hypothetical protein
MSRKKKPVRAKNISFKEQRAKARLDRRMHDRDHGGWAAEWSRDRGDHQYWSKMTQNDWVNSRISRPGSQQGGRKRRPQSANPFGRNAGYEPLVSNASSLARAHNPELSQNSSNQYGQPMAQSFQLDPTYPPTNLKYKSPIVSQNPALLKVAGKSSSLISREKNKKQLFENLEDNNRKICKDAVRIRKSSSKSSLSSKRSNDPRQRPSTAHAGRKAVRRSFSSQASRGSSRSSNSSKQENALRNSQALLGSSTFQGPPYAYQTHTRGAQKDRYGSQYGNFFDFENNLYSNYTNTRGSRNFAKK